MIQDILFNLIKVQTVHAAGVLGPFTSGNPPTEGDLLGVANAVVNLMAASAGGVALCMFGYASFLLFVSSGVPEKVQKARQIATMTVIGLTLIILSGSAAATYVEVLQGTIAATPEDTIMNALTTYIYPMLAAFAFFGFIWGGVLYITSGGDEKKLVQGRNIIIYTAIGTVLLIITYGLILWYQAFVPATVEFS